MNDEEQKVLAFPSKPVEVLQVLHEGEMWYVYRLDYVYEGAVWPASLWAKSDRDAIDRLHALAESGCVIGRLKDIREEQAALTGHPDFADLPSEDG
jgi:hypothetical protein